MNQSNLFQINSPHVVREYFDNEVVVVNLESGTYYSLENISARIWALLDSGSSSEQICADIAASTGHPPEQVAKSVTCFINELSSEGLIVPCTVPTPPADAADRILAKGRPASLVFQEPALKKYTDMQDLLLLDPVHDVDEAGWPIPQPDER